MKQTNKTMAIVFFSIAAVVLVAGIVCMVLTGKASGNAAFGWIIGVPFAILFLLFIFLGIYNIVIYSKEKQKTEKKF